MCLQMFTKFIQVHSSLHAARCCTHAIAKNLCMFNHGSDSCTKLRSPDNTTRRKESKMREKYCPIEVAFLCSMQVVAQIWPLASNIWNSYSTILGQLCPRGVDCSRVCSQLADWTDWPFCASTWGMLNWLHTMGQILFMVPVEGWKWHH